MTRPVLVYQGEDKLIECQVTGVSAATEIEVTIDCNPQVIKTLSGGSVSNVSSSGFNLQIDASDLTSIKPGLYKYQGRATIGTLHNIRFTPNQIRLLESVFETSRNVRDYGS